MSEFRQEDTKLWLDLNDWLLLRIQEFRDGDPYVWAQFTREAAGRLLPFAIGHCGPNFSREDAEDAIQATLVKAWGLKDKIDPESNPGGWLYKVCRNEILDILRRRRVAGRTALSLDHPTGESAEGSSQTLAAQIVDNRQSTLADHDLSGELVQRLLDQLKPDERRIAMLRYLEGRSVHEVARDFDVSEAAMRARIHRIHVKLRDLYEQLRHKFE